MELGRIPYEKEISWVYICKFYVGYTDLVAEYAMEFTWVSEN